MKTKQNFLALFIILALFANANLAFSQTLGWLTFSSNTTAPSANWGNKHVVAIWIEDVANPSNFIKTNLKLGHEDDHLTSWRAKSSSNTVDAITGATPSSYGTQTITWDGRNVNSQLVADGTYKVFIEMGWGSNKVSQHSVMGFEFTKGPNADNQTPTGNSHFTNVTVDWVPSAVSISKTEVKAAPTVFPNPSKGVVNLKINLPLKNAEVSVINSIGTEVYKGRIDEGFVGNYPINLQNKANGLYFVKVVTATNIYILKTVIYKQLHQ